MPPRLPLGRAPARCPRAGSRTRRGVHVIASRTAHPARPGAGHHTPRRTRRAGPACARWHSVLRAKRTVKGRPGRPRPRPWPERGPLRSRRPIADRFHPRAVAHPTGRVAAPPPWAPPRPVGPISSLCPVCQENCTMSDGNSWSPGRHRASRPAKLWESNICRDLYRRLRLRRGVTMASGPDHRPNGGVIREDWSI